MTLEEAIKHCEEIAMDKANRANLLWDSKEKARCEDCANEHRQLAEWLRELEAYRGILANADKLIESEYGCIIIEGYADVLDKMNEVFKEANADDSN